MDKLTASRTETTRFISIIAAVSCAHFLNDVMQSMLPAIYPHLRDNYGLTFLQIGVITSVYQIMGSILQPLIGFYTDKHPLPYSLPFASVFTMVGLLFLAYAHSYYELLLGAMCIGLGSSIFHPSASRLARLASKGRHGFAQSIFQLGGNAGTAMGPLLAALLISQQQGIAWLAPFAFIGIAILTYVSRWYAKNLQKQATRNIDIPSPNLNQRKIVQAVFILIVLMFAKYIYLASIQNYYAFYLIEKFNLDIRTAQIMLFLYLGGIALGTVIGGPIGDRVGARTVIWFSILGVLPFTIALPFANLTITAILAVVIGIILASAFPAIVVFAQNLIPGKIGTISGFLFGLSFGIGAISASVLGNIGDMIGLQNLFIICSFLPLLGAVAAFLPNLKTGQQ